MTMEERIKMHHEIEQENKKKAEEFKDLVALIYKADNMNRTFHAGDKLYVACKGVTLDGDIIVFRFPEGFKVCRVYNGPGDKMTLTDEKNPPEIVDNPDILGTVVGFERLF